jgi:hypothetical protein
MTDERKKELFPYFALVYSKQLNPDKYGEAQNYEEWSKMLDDSPEDVGKITEAASTLTDEQWEALDKQYKSESAEEAEQEAIMAKKGAKLAKLQAYKKGKKVGPKKCSCGCEMVSVKGKGGVMTSKCSCGCKTKK